MSVQRIIKLLFRSGRQVEQNSSEEERTRSRSSSDGEGGSDREERTGGEVQRAGSDVGTQPLENGLLCTGGVDELDSYVK